MSNHIVASICGILLSKLQRCTIVFTRYKDVCQLPALPDLNKDQSDMRRVFLDRLSTFITSNYL